MFGRSITLFKLLGFSVRIDISWIVIASLVTWSLATGLFPQRYENLSAGTYWLMGAVGAIGLFVSIIFHELCHSLVARMFGLTMSGITLFIFGGVAEMDGEPESARVEFLMAAAGPLSSIFLAVCFLAVYGFREAMHFPVEISGVIAYLGLINLALAAFNLVPAFPLDGGRILRAALWSWKDNMRWATRTASRIGSGFGLALILLGLLSVLRGNFIGGMWWFMIGMFLRSAANMSYKQLITRQALRHRPPLIGQADRFIRRVVNQLLVRQLLKCPRYTRLPDFQELRDLIGVNERLLLAQQINRLQIVFQARTQLVFRHNPVPHPQSQPPQPRSRPPVVQILQCKHCTTSRTFCQPPNSGFPNHLPAPRPPKPGPHPT